MAKIDWKKGEKPTRSSKPYVKTDDKKVAPKKVSESKVSDSDIDKALEKELSL